jgi:hypothetical protein
MVCSIPRLFLCVVGIREEKGGYFRFMRTSLSFTYLSTPLTVPADYPSFIEVKDGSLPDYMAEYNP